MDFLKETISNFNTVTLYRPNFPHYYDFEKTPVHSPFAELCGSPSPDSVHPGPATWPLPGVYETAHLGVLGLPACRVLLGQLFCQALLALFLCRVAWGLVFCQWHHLWHDPSPSWLGVRQISFVSEVLVVRAVVDKAWVAWLDIFQALAEEMDVDWVVALEMQLVAGLAV